MTDFKKISVLLIEDNPGDAILIREMLFDAGEGRFDLTIASSLQEGLTQIRQDGHDIILLDLSLPDSAGMDTLFKARLEAPETAIIVLTGFDDQTVIGVHAVKTGAQDYLVKDDVDGKLLRRSISYAIERHRIERELRRSQQEYRSLIDDVFDISTVAVIILDKQFNIVWCNEATEIYFGIERERLLGKDKRELIDSELKCVFDDPDSYANHLHKSYEDNSFTDLFECHVFAEGDREERWLQHWSQPIRSGMYSGGRIEQYTDITQRKNLEIAELAARNFSDSLRDIAAFLTSTLELSEVLERILSNLHVAAEHDSAAITLLEDDYAWVARRKQSSTKRDTQELVAERQLQIEYAPFLDQMFSTHQPIIVADLQQESEVSETAIRANVCGFVGAPIVLRNRVIGFINMFSHQADYFTTHNAERLLAFAELAAIAIQNARLFQESQELAAVEERQRLARDLHDSVSQTLFTCRTMAETALRRWERDPDRARELVEEVHELTMTALNEMRILLLELRPSALTQVSLKELFDQYLKPIEARKQFELIITIDDIPTLPPDVQIAFYRIAQEALNNIDKHAQATQVEIRVNDRPGKLELHIKDNGSGFDDLEIAGTSLGLNIMRERAGAVGAQLTINSEVGTGTHVCVIWDKREFEL
ncbi:MAG: histidine kinase [Aggregatilineales bacterium]